MSSDGDRDGGEALRLKTLVERERAKLRALQEISSALGSTLDLGELLEMILDRISEVMEADRSTLYLLDEETDELWSKVAQGEETHEIRLKLGEGLAGAVASTGKTRLIDIFPALPLVSLIETATTFIHCARQPE